MPSEQPFAGLEVVEFGQFIAVPFCAQLLSEGGAHVIKVESLAGDPTRQLLPLAPGETRHFISRNRGKHSLPLDLRHPAAARIVEALVARADVVLTNFRPGWPPSSASTTRASRRAIPGSSSGTSRHSAPAGRTRCSPAWISSSRRGAG
jgi:hypothetical protein